MYFCICVFVFLHYVCVFCIYVFVFLQYVCVFCICVFVFLQYVCVFLYLCICVSIICMCICVPTICTCIFVFLRASTNKATLCLFFSLTFLLVGGGQPPKRQRKQHIFKATKDDIFSSDKCTTQQNIDDTFSGNLYRICFGNWWGAGVLSNPKSPQKN